MNARQYSQTNQVFRQCIQTDKERINETANKIMQNNLKYIFCNPKGNLQMTYTNTYEHSFLSNV